MMCWQLLLEGKGVVCAVRGQGPLQLLSSMWCEWQFLYDTIVVSKRVVYQPFRVCQALYSPHAELHFMSLHFVINGETHLGPYCAHARVDPERGLLSAATPSSTITYKATITSSAQGCPAIMAKPPTRTGTPPTMLRELMDIAPAVPDSQPAMASDHMEDATELRDPVNVVFNIVGYTLSL